MSRQSQMVREDRRRQTAALYLQGKWQSEIAQILGVHQTQVSYDLKFLQRRWYQESVADIAQRKAIELQRIDKIERECWEAYERSKQPREVTVTEATEGAHPGRKATLRKEGQVGDPRFLTEIGKCVDRRVAILGIGAREEALKNAGLGLAALLDEARQQTVLPTTPLLPPMAQA